MKIDREKIEQTKAKIECLKRSNPYYQNNPILFDELVLEVFKSLSAFGAKLKSKRLAHLKYWMSQQLSFLNANSYTTFDYSTTQCAYMIFFGIISLPHCPICGRLMDSPKMFGNIFIGFLKSCSKKCGEVVRDQSFVKTCNDRYGVPHYAMNKQ